MCSTLKLRRTKYLLSGTWFSLFFTACANIIAPTGGPVDDTPPKLLQSLSTPNDQNNTNMQGEQITLFFDEPTNADAVKANIVGTPEIEVKPIKIIFLSMMWAFWAALGETLQIT